MLSARKILFYLFLLAYCVLCPVLILYSFGYILHPVNKELSQTGIIYLETIPPGADIYLQKSRYKYKTPVSIRELLPGRYHITIKLKGYRSWDHEALIEKGKATVFKDIILVPKNFNPLALAGRSEYQSLILLPDTDSFILLKSPQLKDFFIFNWEKESLKPLLGKDASYGDLNVSGIYTQREIKKMIIFGGSLWNKEFYLFDFKNKRQKVTDITKLLGGKPDEFIWNTVRQDDCFVRYGDHIDRLDFRKMSVYPRFIEDIKGFGLSDKWLYILKKDNRILRSALDEKQPKVLFKDKNFGKSLFGRSRFYKIHFLENDIFLFKGEKGDLITTIPPYELLDREVLEKEFYRQNKRLIYWTKNIIYLADFNRDDTAKTLFPDRIDLEVIYEKGKSIAQCFWAHNGTHVLFKDKNEVFLLALVPDSKHHIEHIVKTKDNSDIVYSDETGSLYYLDPSGRMMKLRMIPKENNNGF